MLEKQRIFFHGSKEIVEFPEMTEEWLDFIV